MQPSTQAGIDRELKKKLREDKRYHHYGNRANYYPESLHESLGGLRRRRRAAQDKSRMKQRPTGKRGRTLRERKRLKKDKDARWEAQWEKRLFPFKKLSAEKKERARRERQELLRELEEFDKLQKRREERRRLNKGFHPSLRDVDPWTAGMGGNSFHG